MKTVRYPFSEHEVDVVGGHHAHKLSVGELGGVAQTLDDGEGVVWRIFEQYTTQVSHFHHGVKGGYW